MSKFEDGLDIVARPSRSRSPASNVRWANLPAILKELVLLNGQYARLGDARTQITCLHADNLAALQSSRLASSH